MGSSQIQSINLPMDAHRMMLEPPVEQSYRNGRVLPDDLRWTPAQHLCWN
jgi:hypothetical protein